MIYLFSLIFIWMEIYYVFNKLKLDDNFRNRDISKSSKLDIIYYLLRIFYFFWLIQGIFTNQYELFLLLISLRFLSFPFYHISKRLYVIWSNILPSISMIFIMIIFIYGFIKG